MFVCLLVTLAQIKMAKAISQFDCQENNPTLLTSYQEPCCSPPREQIPILKFLCLTHLYFTQKSKTPNNSRCLAKAQRQGLEQRLRQHFPLHLLCISLKPLIISFVFALHFPKKSLELPLYVALYFPQ